MGVRFDAMIDVVKHHIRDDEGNEHIPSFKAHLEGLLRGAALFEFPLEPKEIFPKSGKDEEGYHSYLDDFLNLSAENGVFFAMPYRVTAIEDPAVVFVMKHLEGGAYQFASCQSSRYAFENEVLETANVFGAEALFDRRGTRSWKITLSKPFAVAVINGKRVPLPPEEMVRNCIANDTRNSVNDFVEEVIYIMDPANFIIRRESGDYRKSVEREQRAGKKSNNGALRKTIMRPHYTCHSEEDTQGFFRGESREPYAAHPVRGHWRTLVSSRYVKMKGKTIYVPQYFTGRGELTGKNGWNYRVMIKESPIKIVPYKFAEKK